MAHQGRCLRCNVRWVWPEEVALRRTVCPRCGAPLFRTTSWTSATTVRTLRRAPIPPPEERLRRLAAEMVAVRGGKPEEPRIVEVWNFDDGKWRQLPEPLPLTPAGVLQALALGAEMVAVDPGDGITTDYRIEELLGRRYRPSIPWERTADGRMEVEMGRVRAVVEPHVPGWWWYRVTKDGSAQARAAWGLCRSKLEAQYVAESYIRRYGA